MYFQVIVLLALSHVHINTRPEAWENQTNQPHWPKITFSHHHTSHKILEAWSNINHLPFSFLGCVATIKPKLAQRAKPIRELSPKKCTPKLITFRKRKCPSLNTLGGETWSYQRHFNSANSPVGPSFDTDATLTDYEVIRYARALLRPQHTKHTCAAPATSLT